MASPSPTTGQVSIGFDPSTGKPKRQTFYGKTRREVADKIAQALHEQNIGTFIEPNKITLGEWLDTWLATYKKMGTKGIRRQTYMSYEYHIRVHIKPTLGQIPLRQLQTNTLQKLFNGMLESGRKNQHEDEDPGLSRGTVMKARKIVKAALKQAVDNDLIIKNPADRNPAATGGEERGYSIHPGRGRAIPEHRQGQPHICRVLPGHVYRSAAG